MYPGIAITTEREGIRSTIPVPEEVSTTADITHPTRSMAAKVYYMVQINTDLKGLIIF